MRFAAILAFGALASALPAIIQDMPGSWKDSTKVDQANTNNGNHQTGMAQTMPYSNNGNYQTGMAQTMPYSNNRVRGPDEDEDSIGGCGATRTTKENWQTWHEGNSGDDKENVPPEGYTKSGNEKRDRIWKEMDGANLAH